MAELLLYCIFFLYNNVQENGTVLLLYLTVTNKFLPLLTKKFLSTRGLLVENQILYKTVIFTVHLTASKPYFGPLALGFR